MPDETDLSRARASLERIQNFDTSELRRDELGEPFNFEDAVQHADRLIGRFKQIPMDSLREFSDHQLSEIRHQADSVLELFEKVLRFNATRNNATGAQWDIIDGISNTYDETFDVLMPFISYGVARTVDFQHLEAEGRTVI